MGSASRSRSSRLSSTPRCKRSTSSPSSCRRRRARPSSASCKRCSSAWSSGRTLLQPIQTRVNTVIQGIRAELNYTLILDADAPGGVIVAVDPALNITVKVLQRLQQAQ